MKISQLMDHWQKEYGGKLTDEQYGIQLSIEDAARLQALCEMFPKHDRDNMLRDLISAGLNELTDKFPYIQGKTVVAHDELGDPLYEDIGPTPTFLKLTRKYMRNLNSRDNTAATNH